MKVISAYMLAVTGGNDSPNVADCKKILSSVGVELSGDEEKRLEELVEEMAGTSLAEVLEKGHALLKTIPGGGGGGGGGGGAASGGASGGGDAAEAKKESSSEEDDGGAMAGGGLFGGDDGDDY